MILHWSQRAVIVVAQYCMLNFALGTILLVITIERIYKIAEI